MKRGLMNLLFGKINLEMRQCGVFGCNSVFQVDASKGSPEIAVCPKCEQRFNQGIINDVHAHTGRIEGSYNVFDERYLR